MLGVEQNNKEKELSDLYGNQASINGNGILLEDETFFALKICDLLSCPKAGPCGDGKDITEKGRSSEYSEQLRNRRVS